jgi:hypothetical protein
MTTLNAHSYTLPNGTIETRSSKAVYTHVVLAVLGATHPAYATRGAETILVAWSGSAKNAEKAAKNYATGCGFARTWVAPIA